MAIPLRVLIVENQPADAELAAHELRRAGFDPDWRRVETEAEYLANLDPGLDVILADYSLPRFDALQALKALPGRNLDIPLIVVTGALGDEKVAECMKRGAADYLLKDRLARLGPAVARLLALRRLREERRRATNQLRLQGIALECAANAIVITDREDRITWVNPAFTRLTGYTSEEALGQDMRLLKSGQQAPSFYENLWATILAGNVWQSEIINRQKGGTLYSEEQTITPVQDEDGRLTHFVSIHHDISARKHAETALLAKNEELRAMGQQLWQAAKLATMGELAASIAHELNNPLNTVTLRIEGLLGQVPETDPMRKALEVIDQEVERMGKLVSNLLEFSRRSQPYVSTVDLREEIEKTLELIQYQLRNRNIALVCEFASDAPMIQADRQQVQQLFLNLFTNAADAMPEGGTLTLRVGVGKYGSMGEGTAPTPPHPHTYYP